MSKLVPPSGFQTTTEINSQRGKKTYTADKGGLYEVGNKKHIKAMKDQGFTEASLNPFTPGDGERGYTCVECGFGSWFKKCSKCGHEMDTPNTDGD